MLKTLKISLTTMFPKINNGIATTGHIVTQDPLNILAVTVQNHQTDIAKTLPSLIGRKGLTLGANDY